VHATSLPEHAQGAARIDRGAEHGAGCGGGAGIADPLDIAPEYAFYTKGQMDLEFQWGIVPSKNLDANAEHLDDYSDTGELCCHTLQSGAISSMMLLDITPNSRFEGIDCTDANLRGTGQHTICINCAVMVPVSSKKALAWVKMYRIGEDRLLMPSGLAYMMLVWAGSISHYVTRNGECLLMTILMRDAHLYLYEEQHPAHQCAYDIHKNVIYVDNTARVHMLQNVDMIKFVLGKVRVQKYKRNFLVGLLCRKIPSWHCRLLACPV